MSSEPCDQEALTGHIIACGIEVHNAFGPGLPESVYRKALVIELRAQGLRVEEKRRVPLTHRGIATDYLEIDILVEEVVVVEVKAVAAYVPVHSAQVVTYLKLTGCPVGLLMNFNVKRLADKLGNLPFLPFFPFLL